MADDADPEAAYTEALMFLAVTTRKLLKARQRVADLEAQMDIQVTRISELRVGIGREVTEESDAQNSAGHR
jgi:hypothetical protein